MKGYPIRYSLEELAWLEAHRTLPISGYHAAFQATFGREISMQALHSLRKRKGWKTGRTGQFPKGAVPLNKGKPCPPGKGGRSAASRATQFRKGSVPHSFRGAGHEWIDSKDGYVFLIVDGQNPWTGASTRPVLKHRWIWEQAIGPIPDGYVLKCLSEDKTNCDPSNWELIPRQMLPYLGGRFGMDFDHADPELKPAIMAVAKLKHAARTARQRKGAI